jgi:hypothetical protein
LAVPWLADVAPQVLEESPSGSLLAGGLTGLALFSLGWVLFGIASFRARVFPQWAAGVVILGGAQGIQAGYPPFQIVLGLGVGLLGYWLYTRGGVPQGVLRRVSPRQPRKKPARLNRSKRHDDHPGMPSRACEVS